MKKLFLILAAVLLVPTLALAQVSLSVHATTTSGTSLGPHRVLSCKGYSYDPTGDPWAQCTDRGTLSSLNFGTLTTRLKTPTGADNGGAGCFYGEDFFIVYLYPDAWGGRGYDLRQAPASLPAAISNSVVMTPVYARDDAYSGQGPQGDLISGEVLGSPVLARNGGLILTAWRPRIVRAQYSLPPYPAAGDPNPVSDPAWTPVPLTTGAGTYSSGAITIAITER